jgi:hypothetical protein
MPIGRDEIPYEAWLLMGIFAKREQQMRGLFGA